MSLKTLNKVQGRTLPLLILLVVFLQQALKDFRGPARALAFLDNSAAFPQQ